jgi:predicted membrane protein
MAMSETERHITPIGGVKIDADHPASAEVTLVSLVGGIKADLTGASLPEAGLSLTKYSLVGGVNLTVPANVEVEV